MLKGFREFVFRGNVIDLAVAVAVGTAFTALVTAVTQSIIEPIVGWALHLIGGSDGIGGTIWLSDGYELDFAVLIGAIITFIITLTVLYFIIVAPMNRYRRMTGQGAIDTRPPDVRVLEEIRDLLRAEQEARSGGPERGEES